MSGQYPGASADIVADTVVAPLEQGINGVENMLYITSNSTGDGRFQIDVTFDLGTNLDIAQVQVQNRVAVALPRMPADVRNIGVTTAKSSPDLMMVVHLYSPDKSRDTLFISNYATTEVIDQLNRIYGIGTITVFGGRDYSMRIWLDPDRMQSLGADRQATSECPAGAERAGRGRRAEPAAGAAAARVSARGAHARPADRPEGIRRIRREADHGRGGAAQGHRTCRARRGRLHHQFLSRRRPGGRARDLPVARLERARDRGQDQGDDGELSKSFPAGLKYTIVYNPTEFIQQSIDAVVETIIEAILLVVLVVILFLQTWRAAIIPIVAIPISLIGTFFVMSVFGFSLNNLSLFGLVLAIGIVVDDAIVVVENVERNIAAGLSPRDAARKSMDEVGGALIAIALVLCAVFVPAAFITGISGQFYRQFALTIAGATIISLIVSLTLSPAMCALLLKPHSTDHRERWWMRPINGFFRLFNAGFDGLGRGYGWLTARVVSFALIMLVVYAGVLAFGLREFSRTPAGFIPQTDQGYLVAVMQLPGGAALDRTDAVNRRVSELAMQVPGVVHAVNLVGFSGATFTNAPNSGTIFVGLAPFAERAKDPAQSAPAIQRALQQKLSVIEEALVLVIVPPPVRGVGTAGGFRMMIEDRAARGPEALQAAVQAISARAAQEPGLRQVFSLFETSTPQLYLDIDRVKAQQLGINLPDVFGALQTDLGSFYVNDFNLLGRTFRVTAQAEASHRLDEKDVLQIRVRNAAGATVPLGSFTRVSDTTGPYRVPRYNLYPAAELDGQPAPGFSQGQAIDTMQKIARETLPQGFSFEWTTLAYQQIKAGNTASFAFVLGVGVRVSRARRAIREPDAAARGDPDRADVSCRLDQRRPVARAGQ